MKKGADQKKNLELLYKVAPLPLSLRQTKTDGGREKKTFLFFDRLSPRILSFSFVVAVFSGGGDADGTKGHMEVLSIRTMH